MGKEANIKRKSTKTPVILYRICLRVCFASLILLCGLTLQKGFATDDRLYSLALSCTVIFSLLYQIIYYYYKMYSNDIKYNILKEPIKYQILFMVRILIFLLGVVLVVLGAYLTKYNTFKLRPLGIILIPVGLVAAHLLYNNKSIYSHLSTFFTNATMGVVIYSVYYAHVFGLKVHFVWLVALALCCLVISEVSFFFYNQAKHKVDQISLRAQINIRAMYLLRNIVALLILYSVVIVLIITGSLQVFESSNVIDYIFKIIPLLISLVTVSVLLYNNFKKPTKIFTTYAPIKDKDGIVKQLKQNYPVQGMLIKSLDYVMENMNAKTGFVRYSGEDYYFHPLNVAKILIDHSITEEDTLSAALLHDCIEDLRDCDRTTVADLTNEKVADIVQALTKQKGVNYKEEHVMREYLDNILHDAQAVAVKVADRMHNMSSLSNASEEKREAKWEETKLHYLPLLRTATALYPQYNLLFAAAKQFFEEGGE